ncbi:glutathione S-transferase family protein [Catenovulum sediminis]|uniref:glutathione S-transferase family protein n=1 Tax=Catenovulum sediminis TaxID=1740262 RepID=UPI00117CE6F7|nr:glutathione S-transferase family protein [Catenovulum sediminis]
MYKLYYQPGWSSMAPHFLLAEMGVEFQLKLVDVEAKEHKSPDFLKLNPTGRIPVLTDNSLALFESAAICLYVCDKEPQTQMMPEVGTVERAKCYQWLAYLNSTVQTEMDMLFYPKNHTTAPTSAPAIAERQEQRLMAMFEILNNELAQQNYLVGDKMTVCDCFLLMLVMWGHEEFKVSPLTMPNLNRYFKNLIQKQSVQAVCEVEQLDLNVYVV